MGVLICSFVALVSLKLMCEVSNGCFIVWGTDVLVLSLGDVSLRKRAHQFGILLLMTCSAPKIRRMRIEVFYAFIMCCVFRLVIARRRALCWRHANDKEPQSPKQTMKMVS